MFLNVLVKIEYMKVGVVLVIQRSCAKVKDNATGILVGQDAVLPP